MERPAPISVRALLPAPEGGAGIRQDLGFELAVASLRAAGIETEMTVLAPGSGGAPANSEADSPPHLIYLHFPSRRAFRIGARFLQTLETAVPRPLLLAGGSFTSDHAPDLLGAVNTLDGLITGEVEATLVSVATALVEGRPWWQEPGLWLRWNGQVTKTPPRMPIEDLDILPRAATDFLQPGDPASRQVLLSRGCNSNCSYCTMQVPERQAFPLRQRFWRSRSPRSVADEIEDLWRRFGIERFVFHSFVFFGYDQAGTQEVESLARELLSRGLPIRFSFVTHPGHLRRNLHLLPLLRDAGLESVQLGIDSILDRARSLYRLPFSREDIRDSLAALHDERIEVRTRYIFYDPYTTLDEIGENLSFLKTVRPLYSHLDTPYGLLLHHQIVNTFLTLSPSMPIMEMLRSDGLLIREGDLEGPPAARFLDRHAGRFAHLHRRFNQEVLRRVAPIVFHPALEEHFPPLAFFLIDALEVLRSQIAGHSDSGDDAILHELASWSRKTLAPAQEICMDSSLPSRERQELAGTFFQGGGKETSCPTSCTSFATR